MLSDKQILDEIETCNIVIEPFDEQQLGSNSYDVRLGNYVARSNNNQKTIDIFNKDDITRFWMIQKATDIIMVFPGETILSHTQEVIGGRNYIASKMNARSSLGRCGISVCKCAGFGDVGYVNRWTMEITNSLNVSVGLRVGMRVAQISFFKVGETLKQYVGKYQNDGWKPEDMLPRLWEVCEENLR
jgi:dCTP deaminase